MDEVRQTLAESSLDRWRVLVEDFQTEHFPDGDASSRDISAALLKLLMQRDFGNQDNVGEVDELTMAPQRPAKNAEAKSKGRMQPLPRRQESGPMSRLHIDVGQAHDVTPRALVGAITGESGIPGRSVGAIDIQNNFSIVEISAELAAHVLATLNKAYIPVREQNAEAVQRERQERAKVDVNKLQASRMQAAAQAGQQEQQKPMPMHVEKKAGRNDPCPCGSGKKYKNCHGKGM